MSAAKGSYYLPDPSPWPVVTSVGLFLLALGFIFLINSVNGGQWLMLAGVLTIVYMMIRWLTGDPRKRGRRL